MLVIVDRDGVLNQDRPDSVKDPGELVMIAGAAAAVARLNRAGRRVAVCTNQSIVGRGIIDTAMLDRIHVRLREELARAGAHVDAILVCPDPPWAPTRDRKPLPGLLEQALRRFQAEPARTPAIGDALRDLEAAAAAGCPRHLVRTGKGAATQANGIAPTVLPVRVHDDLARAVDFILAEPGA